MHASGMEFTRSEPRERLRLRASAADISRVPARSRQGGYFIFRSVLKRLTLCSALASAAVWLAFRLLPAGIRWTVGAWSAVALAVVFAVGSSAISWVCCHWELTDHRLLLRRGVLIREDISLSPGSIISVELRQSPMSAVFNSAQVCIRTARPTRRPITLLLNRRAAGLLAGQLMPPCRRGRIHSYRADSRSLWLGALSGEGLAAFWSAAAALLTALHDIAGLQPAGELWRLILHWRAIPLAAGVIALVWLSKILHTRLTRAGMAVSRSGGLLTLTRGVISRRSEVIRLRDMAALDIRWPLPAMPARRRSCSVILRSGESYPLLPPVDERRLRIETAALSPHGPRVCAVLPMSSPLAYAAGRWLICLGVLPAVTVLRHALPVFSSAIHAAGVIAAGILLWRAFVTTLCAAHAGIRLFADSVEITGVRQLTVHTLRIFRPSVGMIRITQGPINRLAGRCTVTFSPRGKGERMRCIKLPFQRALAVCERLM